MSEAERHDFYRQLEITKSDLQMAKFDSYALPDFDLGWEYLGLEKTPDGPAEISARTFITDWFKTPEKYLRPTKSWQDVPLENRDGFLSFPSVLDPSRLTRFKYDPQPPGVPGRKVALIHVMHWNGRLKPYERIIKGIRRSALPISTLIHIPAGRGLNPGDGDPADYDSVGPNIGKTILRTQADIQDLQFMARALKEQLGYDEVGLFTYSVGSLRGMIAAMMSPELFDFGVFHMVADDFTAAIMEGVSTRKIAARIKGRVSGDLLKTLWSTISPGAYQDFFDRLPRHTRLVQCRYDFTFGPDNIRAFNRKLLNLRPDVELALVDSGHTTLGRLPVASEVMLGNLRFIYRNSLMGRCRRARLFKTAKLTPSPKI